MKIEFLPEAKAELDDAIEYYELHRNPTYWTNRVK